MSDQDIFFRIGVADHPDAGPKLKALADSVREAMRDIDRSILSVGRSAQTVSQSIGSSRFSVPEPLAVGAAASSRALPGTTSTSQSYQSQLTRLSGVMPENIAGIGPPPEAVNRKAKSDAKAYKTSFSETIAQLAGLSASDAALLTGGDKQRFAQLGRDDGEAYRKGLREQLAGDLGLSGDFASELFGAQGGAGLKGQQDEYAAQQKKKTDEYKAESDRLMQSLSGNIDAYAKLDAAGQTASLSMGRNFRELAEKSEGFASGLGQVASGLAFLGAKNENVKSLIDTLLTIKGVSDIGIGVVKSLSGVAQVVSLVKERQQLANKQTEAAAEKTRLARAAASDYVQLLQREGIELEKATQGNREHAAILQRVAAEANQAAAAEREYANAANLPKKERGGGLGDGMGGGVGGGGRRRRGIRGAMDAVGRSFGGGSGRNLLSFGGAMLFGAGGLMSTGSDTGDLLADEGVDYAIDKASQRGGMRRAARAAGRFGRVAAPVAAAAAVGKGLFDVGSGVVNEGRLKFANDSLSERLSEGASRYGGIADHYLGLDTIHGQAYAGRVKFDKQLKDRNERQADSRLRNQAADQNRLLGLAGDYELSDQRHSAFDSVSSLRGQSRTDVESLRIRQSNMQADLVGEQQLASLRSGDGTYAGRRQMAESQNRQMQIGMQVAGVAATAQGVADIGAPTAQQEIDQKRLGVQTELRSVMGDIKTLGADIEANEKSYEAAQKRAFDLTTMLKGVEEDQLRLIGEQTQKRIAGNQEAIEGANKRIELFRREKQAAEDTLKSGAERFASMSRGDQAAAIRAQQMADAGMANQLSDKQRGLLKSIGTTGAVRAAEQADMNEARQRGFFDVFGKEEQQRAAKATQFEQQARVEILNKQAVNVQLQVDMDRIADRVAKQVIAIENRLLANLDKRIEQRVQRERAANMQQANQAIVQAANQRKTAAS